METTFEFNSQWLFLTLEPRLAYEMVWETIHRISMYSA